MKRRTKNIITPEEKLAQALVPIEDQPYSVPENWCWIHLGCISTNQYGYTAKAIADDNLPKMLRITDIQENGVDWEGVPNCEINDSDFAKYKLKENDIVIARIGATTGKCFLLDNPNNTVFASYLIRLRINSAISTEYVYSFLQSEEYWRQISDLSSGIALPGVNSSKLQTMKFPLAPIFEQQRIVDRIESLFAKLDEAKEKAQAVVNGFEDRKAAILHMAFTGDLTKKWREANGISFDSWEKKRINEIGDVVTGSTPDTRQPNLYGGNVPFIKPTELNQGRHILSSYDTLTEDGRNVSRPVRAGTTCVCCIGATISKCGYLEIDAVTNQQINSITPYDFMYDVYVYYYCCSKEFKDVLIENSSSTTLPIINKKRMSALEITVPKKQEQATIANSLDCIFRKEQQAKDAAKKILAQIDTMKKAILARAFRGELGTNDPTDENAIELLRKMLQTESEAKQHED